MLAQCLRAVRPKIIVEIPKPRFQHPNGNPGIKGSGAQPLCRALSGRIAVDGDVEALHPLRQQDGPEVVSGFALAEAARAAASDPLVPLLRHAGLRATFTLLTTGQLDPAAIEGYGAELLLQRPLTLAAEPLLEQFEVAGVPATPYARALDPTGEAVLALIEADPFAKGTPGPILTDGDWISLQAICAE